MADRTVRDYLIEKYGAKSNGEPDVDLQELMNKTSYKKTITLHIAPYPESMVKIANEILEREK